VKVGCLDLVETEQVVPVAAQSLEGGIGVFSLEVLAITASPRAY